MPVFRGIAGHGGARRNPRRHILPASGNPGAAAGVPGAGGVCGSVDGWLVVELDGRHHAEWKQVQKDHRRNNESVLQGYTALRYYYADVVYGPQAMVKQGLRHAPLLKACPV